MPQKPSLVTRLREVEAVRLAARGLPKAMIAKQLGIGERQVYYDIENHREHAGVEPSAVSLFEFFMELFRVGWSDHEAFANEAAKAAIFKSLITLADRFASLQGVELKVPGEGPNIDIRQYLLAPEPVAIGPAGGPAMVDPYTFATSPDFCNLDLSDKPMERMALQDFMRAGSGYTELDTICGMRAGKGTAGSIIAWYLVYGLLQLEDPQRYYGLTPGQEIGTINMAMSRDQAKNNVFKHILDRINYGGRWFQELKAFCDEHFGANWQSTTELHLPKNIVMRCGHSSAKSAVGGTNIGALFDELCKFKTNEGKDNASDVYAQVKATTASFGDDARTVVMSSPEWIGDYGMRLLKMALETDDMNLEDRCPTCRVRAEQPGYEPSQRKSHPHMMGLQLPTWEANQALTYEALWEQHNGESNPRAFWRDFGARPAEAKEGYYPNPERWDEQGDPDLFYPYDKLGRLLAKWKPCCDSRRYVQVDLGLTRNACGIAMAHKPVPGCRWFLKEKLDKDEKQNPKGKKIVVDVMVQVRPASPAPGQSPEIDFDLIRGYIRAWAERGFRIKSGKVTLDGWQSVDFRQQMRKEGFKTAEFSLDRDLKGHDTLQELINTDDLAYYAHPVLIREGKALELKAGKKVDHPEDGSKDVIDAVAGAVYHAYREGGRTVFVGGGTP